MMVNNSRDFLVDEFGLGIEAQVVQFAKAQIAFLYEEGVTDLEIDDALGNLTP